MQTTRSHHPRHMLRRVRSTWAELDYAQRRMFELRTGISAVPPQPWPDTPWANVSELEAVYAAPVHEPRDDAA
jgi:hypothetical protein